MDLIYNMAWREDMVSVHSTEIKTYSKPSELEAIQTPSLSHKESSLEYCVDCP